jgi:hypothetical protein
MIPSHEVGDWRIGVVFQMAHLLNSLDAGDEGHFSSSFSLFFCYATWEGFLFCSREVAFIKKYRFDFTLNHFGILGGAFLENTC